MTVEYNETAIVLALGVFGLVGVLVLVRLLESRARRPVSRTVADLLRAHAVLPPDGLSRRSLPLSCPDCGVYLGATETKAHIAPCGAPCLFAIRTNPIFVRTERAEMHVAPVVALAAEGADIYRGTCPLGCFDHMPKESE